MLERCIRARCTALIGPSMRCPPDALFAHGVTLIGGSWVLDGSSYLEALRRAVQRSGRVEKAAIARDAGPGFDALLKRL